MSCSESTMMKAIFSTKTRNATYIKLKALMNSVSIQLCLFLLLLGSVTLSFFPWISNQFISEQPLRISVSDAVVLQTKHIELVTDEADIDISYKNESEAYIITVYTERGRASLSEIRQIVNNLNVKKLLQDNLFTPQQIKMMTNENVEIVDDVATQELSESKYIFLMLIVFMYFIMATILISRIGAQVASEKGNNVTEVILTSLTRKQLYFADVLSSFLVTMLSFVVISIPILVASVIDIPGITSDFSFLRGTTTLWVLSHLILSSFSLVLLSIGLCSLAKQAEDSNAFSSVLLLPLLISYLYTILNHSLYQGVWVFLNYIPLFSTFTILSGLIASNLTAANMMWYIIADCFILVFEIFTVRVLYARHISKS